jgi:hypothetical protein
VVEREGIPFWRVEREDRSGGDGVVSLHGEATYQERIAPRVRDSWTVEEICALED